MAKGYSYFMVHVEAGRHLRLGVLTPAERCAWTHGVLAIAAKCEMRGAFMVADRPATAADVALQANVPTRVASSMLRKARETRLLEHDSEIDAEWVRDFEQHNPEPKVDATAAERARNYRARQKAGRDASRSVTRDARDASASVTPPEVEGEEEVEEVVVEERAPDPDLEAGVAAGVHPPSLPEVVSIFVEVKAKYPALQIEEAALSSAIRSKASDPDCDPVAAAHAAAAMVHAGDARRLVASVLLLAALDRQQANALRARQSGRPASGSSTKPAPVVDFSKYDKRAANG